jgi:hypothetical protein
LIENYDDAVAMAQTGAAPTNEAIV